MIIVCVCCATLLKIIQEYAFIKKKKKKITMTLTIWICFLGFELNVHVVTLDTNLTDTSKCQQNITSSGLSRGRLISSDRTWPLLTTCSFRFQGRSNERVWIYFLKYHFGTATGTKPSRRLSSKEPCHNNLKMGDIQPWVGHFLLY